MCLTSQEFKAPSLQDYPECSLRRARGKRKALEGKRNTEIPTPKDWPGYILGGPRTTGGV